MWNSASNIIPFMYIQKFQKNEHSCIGNSITFLNYMG